MKILYLTRWYPHRFDPMPGLFVQRQAEAVFVHCDVTVLYLHEDPACQEKYEVVATTENGVRVLRVYYKVSHGTGLFTRVSKLSRFLKAGCIGLKEAKAGSFDLVHVHVLTRLAILALWNRFRTGVPYVVTEHWSRYFEGNDTYKGLFRKKLTKLVVHFAAAMIAVSAKLKEAMEKRHLRNRKFLVIPNPVDMNEFRISERSRASASHIKRMIHVSCFEDKSKNISGLLRVLKTMSGIRTDFECILVGEGPDWETMKAYAEELGLLDKYVFFPGMKTGADLVIEFNLADFMVLSSHYETFASVVVEALACGIPVVATDVGIVSEVVDRENGLIVTLDDDQALLKAIGWMSDNFEKFDRPGIRKSVSGRFSNGIIGDQLFRLYGEMVPESFSHLK